jgi:DNA-binding transcriptional ArsR family regulator
VDEVFRALADPSRRRLLDRLNDHDGQTLRELCAGQGLTRQAISKHLAILEAATLVRRPVGLSARSLGKT